MVKCENGLHIERSQLQLTINSKSHMVDLL